MRSEANIEVRGAAVPFGFPAGRGSPDAVAVGAAGCGAGPRWGAR
ncbi:hypothetical protein TPA0909_42930 [Streptomyces albus]|nr:hypothetical protein TPA0909_42930 [Streptomyces albus]